MIINENEPFICLRFVSERFAVTGRYTYFWATVRQCLTFIISYGGRQHGLCSNRGCIDFVGMLHYGEEVLLLVRSLLYKLRIGKRHTYQEASCCECLYEGS